MKKTKLVYVLLSVIWSISGSAWSAEEYDRPSKNNSDREKTLQSIVQHLDKIPDIGQQEQDKVIQEKKMEEALELLMQDVKQTWLKNIYKKEALKRFSDPLRQNYIKAGQDCNVIKEKFKEVRQKAIQAKQGLEEAEGIREQLIADYKRSHEGFEQAQKLLPSAQEYQVKLEQEIEQAMQNNAKNICRLKALKENAIKAKENMRKAEQCILTQNKRRTEWFYEKALFILEKEFVSAEQEKKDFEQAEKDAIQIQESFQKEKQDCDEALAAWEQLEKDFAEINKDSQPNTQRLEQLQEHSLKNKVNIERMIKALKENPGQCDEIKCLCRQVERDIVEKKKNYDLLYRDFRQEKERYERAIEIFEKAIENHEKANITKKESTELVLKPKDPCEISDKTEDIVHFLQSRTFGNFVRECPVSPITDASAHSNNFSDSDLEMRMQDFYIPATHCDIQVFSQSACQLPLEQWASPDLRAHVIKEICAEWSEIFNNPGMSTQEYIHTISRDFYSFFSTYHTNPIPASHPDFDVINTVVGSSCRFLEENQNIALPLWAYDIKDIPNNHEYCIVVTAFGCNRPLVIKDSSLPGYFGVLGLQKIPAQNKAVWEKSLKEYKTLP
jgi:tetratricopeptide (TPR) repeat protein